jgi:protoporphyrinogen oxidase
MKSKTQKFGILGGGPSGLSVAQFLKHDSTILEREDHPGGLAASFFDQGYTFDFAPHIIFSRDKKVLDFIVKSLGSNSHTVKRSNKVCYKGIFMKYPFENDLAALPKQETYECLIDYLSNPYKQKYSKPKNLAQWFLSNFGQSICEKYLFPYNEKVWNLPVKDLSMTWASRIPNPPVEDIVKSALGIPTEGYTHQLYFHYPLQGGYQSISEAWAKKAKIIYNFNVKKITKTKNNTFIVSNGKDVHLYNQLVSTIPIHELIKITNLNIPAYVRKAVDQLIVNPLLIVSLGIKGEDKNKFTAIYFPDKDFPVNRVSFPGTMSPNNAPQGTYSLQAEITCKSDSATWKLSDEVILNQVIDGLATRGIIPDKAKIVYRKVSRVKYAYVVYDSLYEKNVAIIRDWFPRQGIHLVGRFSYFEYVNVDGAVITAKKISEALNRER